MNSSFQTNNSSRRFKNYRHPRVRREAKRNSVFSLISDYIEKKGINKAIRRPGIDEGVYFQIFGMCILTIALVLTFQSFVSSDSLSINAEQQDNKKVRLLTNFQYQPDDGTGKKTRLQDFSVAPIPQPTNSDPTVNSSAKNESDPAFGVSANQQTLVKPSKHIVLDGENVYSIAADYAIKPQDIIQKNNLEAPYNIKVGDELIIS